MKKIIVGHIAALGLVVMGAIAAPAHAAGGTSDDDAYYTKMQRDLLNKSRASSTAAKEADIRQKARASAECNDLKRVSTEAGRRHAENHIAPDPTKVIENNTCFIDVQSVGIPSTGIGFADQLLKNFLSSNVRNCPNGSNNWSGVVSSVRSGNWKQAGNLAAIQTFSGQTQNLAPQGSALDIPVTSYPSTGSSADSYRYPPSSGPSNYQSSPSVSRSTVPSTSLADRLWSRFTGGVE